MQVPWFLIDASRAIKPILFQKRRDYQFRSMDKMDDEHVFSYDQFRYGVDGRCNAGYGLWHLAYGSVEPLTADAFRDARRVLHEMRGDQGRSMGVMPTHLIIPPALEEQGLEILNAERNANGATNVWRGRAKLHMSVWLAR